MFLVKVGRSSNTVLQKIHKATVIQLANVHPEKRAIGEREIVGWGVNAWPHYIDRVDYPFPAIRFKETKGPILKASCGYFLHVGCQPNSTGTKTLNVPQEKSYFPFQAIRAFFKKALKEKEKGDWKKLSIEDKKAIYRASFCQTFSEFLAPSGQWKMIVGWSLMLISIGIWGMLALKKFVYPPLPASFSEESRRAQLRRQIDLKVNPITGISSKWDYEKDDWKK